MTRDNRRDQRIADETSIEAGNGCAAPGCPNPWTVDGGGTRLCSAHSRASSPREWPAITQQQLDAVADQARRNSSRQQSAPTNLTPEERRAIALRLREILSASRGTGTAWAYALRERHRNGERLTPAQIDSYQAAIAGRFAGLEA